MRHPTGFYQPLPANLYPTGEVCVNIRIPNDVDWIKTFWGHFLALTRWATFERDISHSARIVASRWQQIWNASRAEFNAGTACYVPPQLRQNPCGVLQISLDSGATWDDWADLNNCFVKLYPGDADNIIIPTGNYPALSLQAPIGHNTWLFDVNSALRIYGAGQMNWSVGTVQLSQGGAQFLVVQSGAITLAAHPAFTKVLSPRPFGLGDTSSPAAWLDVSIVDTDEIGDIIRAAAGQTGDLRQHKSSANALYSGVDKVGRYFITRESTLPSAAAAHEGAIVALQDTETIGMYINGHWVEVGQGADCECITGAEATTLPPGSDATAEIVDGILMLGIPSGQDATSSFPEYPRAATKPALGESTEWFVKVSADGMLEIPCEIGGCYVATLECQGQWSDDDFTPFFGLTEEPYFPQMYCADGSYYNATDCENTPSDPMAGQFVPDEPHMALMLAVLDVSSPPVWISEGQAYNRAFGAFLSNITRGVFFPNAIKSDGNIGEIRMRLIVANGYNPLDNCAEWDFTLAEWGWHVKGATEPPTVLAGDAPTGGEWIDTVGYNSTNPTSSPTAWEKALNILSPRWGVPFSSTARFRFTFVKTANFNTGVYLVHPNNTTTLIQNINLTGANGVQTTVTFTAAMEGATRLLFAANTPSTDPDALLTIKSIEIINC